MTLAHQIAAAVSAMADERTDACMVGVLRRDSWNVVQASVGHGLQERLFAAASWDDLLPQVMAALA